MLELATALDLPEWKELPPVFRPDEIEAINRGFTCWQKSADDYAERCKGPGARSIFHKDEIEPLQRVIIIMALDQYAMECGMQKRPTDSMSSYLKSWLIYPSPYTLLKVGRQLEDMGRRDKAQATYQVVLLNSDERVAKRSAKEHLAELEGVTTC
jgi:hypothetical protein